MKRHKVLVVGQTPPPYGGQAIMIDNLLRANFKHVSLYHVRMAFSTDMDEIGKFKLAKVFTLLKLISRIIYMRFRYSLEVLYYPPAGPDKTPMFRDIIILTCTRWLFKKCIFHFHAGGISTLHSGLSTPLKLLFQKAYFFPDAAIRISDFNPADGVHFKCRKEYIIPNGLEDSRSIVAAKRSRNPEAPVNILFVGFVKESKGALILLEACRLLQERNLSFTVTVMGKFESAEFKKIILDKVSQSGIAHLVSFVGVQTGEQKFSFYQQADIFCFPSFFESETFGLVLLEAMQFELPIVSTNWRGIPSVVTDGQNGFLVPVKNAQLVAQKLELLIQDKALRETMGKTGREMYLKYFTQEKFNESMEKVFVEVANY